jgi:intermediate peptidase
MKDKKTVIRIFDNLSNDVCLVADLAEFIRLSHPNPQFVLSAEEACVALSILVEQLNTNRDLYDCLKAVDNVDGGNSLDDLVLQLFLFDFEQSGIHLSHERRKLVVELNRGILEAGSYFVQNSMNKRSVKKSRIHSSQVINSSEGDDLISFSSLCSDNPNPSIRETAFKTFLHPDAHQEQLLSQLLQSRLLLSNVCGFKSYSERAVKGSIMQSPERVLAFLDRVSEGIRPLAEEDYNEILRVKRLTNSSHCREVYPWDVPYYTSVLKERSETNSVFSLKGCLNGLDMIFESLFGIKLVMTKCKPGETWHQDVFKLSVMSEDDVLLGHIYCDFFERRGKSQQDSHFTIQGGCRVNQSIEGIFGDDSSVKNNYQNPIIVIMLSLSRPSLSFSANSLEQVLHNTLLTPHQVDNLFHEFGHGIHSMIARTEYQHITGTRVSTDLAEVPSILMEYFANDRRVLKHISSQSDSSLDNWIESKKILSAAETQLQTFYSALDQVYHSSDPFMSSVTKTKSTTAVLEQVQNKYYSLPYIKDTAWQLRFSHLVGYGAKYYSYLVSRAVAYRIWNTLFKNDPLNREAGIVYKNQILSHGGGKNARQLAQDALQAEPTPEFLADSIINEVKEHRK